MNATTTPIFPTGTKRDTRVFTCQTCDEAFALIRAHKPENFWAQIICLSDSKIELHLRPLEEKDY